MSIVIEMRDTYAKRDLQHECPNRNKSHTPARRENSSTLSHESPFRNKRVKPACERIAPRLSHESPTRNKRDINRHAKRIAASLSNDSPTRNKRSINRHVREQHQGYLMSLLTKLGKVNSHKETGEDISCVS